MDSSDRSLVAVAACLLLAFMGLVAGVAVWAVETVDRDTDTAGTKQLALRYQREIACIEAGGTLLNNDCIFSRCEP